VPIRPKSKRREHRMLSPCLILYFQYSTFEVGLTGKLPTLYFQRNVLLTMFYVTFVVLTSIFPRRESSARRPVFPKGDA